MCMYMASLVIVSPSVGPIGYPLFPGENEVEQLACIMEIFGLPPTKLLEDAQRRKIFFGAHADHTHVYTHYTHASTHITHTQHTHIQLITNISIITDSKGNPRCIVNSKGKRHRPGTKELAMALKTNDALFLDFIKRCLW